jgi:hypothetical protein
MSAAGGIREPRWPLVANCGINIAVCGLLTSFVLALAASDLRADSCSLVTMGLVSFPAASIIAWNYRAVYRRDEQAAAMIANLSLVFGVVVAWLSVAVTMSILAGARATWLHDPWLLFVPACFWSVACYLLWTGFRFRSWSKQIESDLKLASRDMQAEHRSALQLRRWSMRELFLLVTALCVILGLAVSLNRAMFSRHDRWGQVQSDRVPSARSLAFTAASGISRSFSTRPPMMVSSIILGTSSSWTCPYQIPCG